MNPDRRDGEEPRREDDRLVDYRLDRIDVTIDHMATTVQGLGSAVGHLALLDARSDENRRRLDVAEKRMHALEANDTEIRVAIEGLRTRLLFICALGSIAGTGASALVLKLAGG